MPAATDLTGQTFGELVALSATKLGGRRAWECQCSCGERKTVRADALMRGNTSSCRLPGRHHPTVDIDQPFYGPIIHYEVAKAKNYKWYVTGRPCEKGHVCERQVANYTCRLCGAEGNAERCKTWYQNGGDAIVKAASQQWVKDNPERRKEIANKYNRKMLADPAFIADKNKRRREGNRNNNRRLRYQNDSSYRTMIKFKGRLAQALKLQSANKAHKTAEQLGTTIQAFRNWIALQFKPGMSWDNHAYDTWHIDHIRPCESFDLNNPDHQMICFNWRNHQPLEAAANLSKNDKWTPEMEAAWVVHMRKLGWKGDLALIYEPA